MYVSHVCEREKPREREREQQKKRKGEGEREEKRESQRECVWVGVYDVVLWHTLHFV